MVTDSVFQSAFSNLSEAALRINLIRERGNTHGSYLLLGLSMVSCVEPKNTLCGLEGGCQFVLPPAGGGGGGEEEGEGGRADGGGRGGGGGALAVR